MERARRWLERANAPVDPASLIAFRWIFGLVMVASAIRFLSNGWVDLFFGQPSMHFTYPGFWFLTPLSPTGMTAAMVLVGVLAALVATGVAYRFAIVGFFLLFTWVELLDVTNYLNHYVLVSALSLVLCFLPLGRGQGGQRAWMVWLLRFQVGVVYVFAAWAKANSDWLVHGQPLGIWLSAHTDLPGVGPYLAQADVAVALSRLGFAYDALIVPALLWRVTRPAAFVVLIGFHTATGVLFEIGMFPWIMTGAATIFFAPDWPRRFGLGRPAIPSSAGRLKPVGALLLAAWLALNVLVPLRSTMHPGPVNWHEQGMRFAWKVMVRQKSASLVYRVRVPGEARPRLVSPQRYLTDRQAREMAGQPDLILQLARHVGDDFRARGYGEVEVRADALVSWNGRPPARLIDPDVDLLSVPEADTGWLAFRSASWILPAPETTPIRLRPARLTARK